MKSTRKIILSGLLAVTVLMIMSTNLVYAGKNGGSAGTAGDIRVFLMKKDFAICGQYDTDTPDDSQQSGCIQEIFGEYAGLRVNEYAFYGEKIAELVVARSPLGAELLTGANMVVEGAVSQPMCNDVTNDETKLTMSFDSNGKVNGAVWTPFTDPIDVTTELKDMPPAYSVGASDGFNVVTDRVYQCIFTVSDEAYQEDGTPVYVEVYARGLDMPVQSQWQLWFFNPEIIIDVSLAQGGEGASLEFETGVPGQTVYATDTLLIKNCAEGGVDLMVWMAGRDLLATSSEAKCPDSQVLAISNVDFRCKIGTLFNDVWTPMPYYNSNLECISSDGKCKGAEPLLEGSDNELPFEDGLLANGHTAECWFRLTYPEPICYGEFSAEQAVLIIARAI